MTTDLLLGNRRGRYPPPVHGITVEPVKTFRSGGVIVASVGVEPTCHDTCQQGWHPLYRFRYRGSDHTLYVGVMAQDAQKIDPSAVSYDGDGFLMVDYDQIGVNLGRMGGTDLKLKVYPKLTCDALPDQNELDRRSRVELKDASLGLT